MQTDAPSASFDLDAYLNRIKYDGPITPTQEVLEGLHQAHATQIPFENLDLMQGRPIRLDLESLQAKMVGDHRGGYCFEQNTLMAAALERVGFSVTPLAARVRFGSQHIRPRTHMLLMAEVEGRSWLVDVGFGGAGPIRPIPLEEGRLDQQFGWRYRLVREGDSWVLRYLQRGNWIDLYIFTMEPQYPVDFEMANWYLSTHPDAVFVRTLIVQFPRPNLRYALRNREFTIDHADGPLETHTIGDDEEFLTILAEKFGLSFPPGTRFPTRQEL